MQSFCAFPPIGILRFAHSQRTNPSPDLCLSHDAAMARDLRQQALERLAALSTTSSADSFDKSDLDKLCRAAPNRQGQVSAVNGAHNATVARPEVGRVPMVA